MTNSPIAGMNTSMEPAMMPGSDSGRVTDRKVCQGREPRSAEASSSEVSSFTSVGVERQDHEGQVGVDDADIDGEIGLHHHQRLDAEHRRGTG
jgi:hypothetical protein